MAAFIGGHGPVFGTPRYQRMVSTPSVIRGGRFAHIQKNFPVRFERRAAAEAKTPMRMRNDAPPINVPSGVLLLSSSVLAIAAVGCVFELTGGHPTYGSNLTSGILAVSLPGFLFLFYSAIKKGQQEAMEDP